MSINAINGLSSGYAGASQVDTEYEEIKKKLMALGVTPSGNKTVDKVKLEQAQRESELENAQKTASEQAKPTNNVSMTEEPAEEEESDEFVSYLTQINVSQTGDVENDYRNAINELRSRFLAETDPSELSQLRTVKDGLDRIMASLGYSTISIAASEMSGATAKGEQNKVMMLNPGGFSTSGK